MRWKWLFWEQGQLCSATWHCACSRCIEKAPVSCPHQHTCCSPSTNSPDLTPCDCFLLSKMKLKLKRCHFETRNPAWITDRAWFFHRTGPPGNISSIARAMGVEYHCTRGQLWRGWWPDLNRGRLLLFEGEVLNFLITPLIEHYRKKHLS